MCVNLPSVTSNLGTKNYWKEFYAKEYENFQDHGDTGDIWFGKKNVDRIINWLLEKEVEKLLPILDVGCGNGMTLISLARAGFQNLTGVDYISDAVQLAKSISEDNKLKIKYEALDFLQDISELHDTSALHNIYEVIIDKGTYDAVGLCPEDGNRKRDQYVKQVLTLLSQTGFFIIISCNWTKEELLSHFEVKLFNDYRLSEKDKFCTCFSGVML